MKKLLIFIIILTILYNRNKHVSLSNEKEYYFILENFLDDNFINEIYKTITTEDKWLYTTNRGNEKIKHNNNLIERRNTAYEMYDRGSFSYSKYEYENELLLKNIELILTDKKTLKLVSDIVGENISNVMDIFISKYEKGDFLSEHTDKTLGKYAFMIYLNKNWDKNCGGNLNVIKNDETFDTLIPKYNRLVLMDIYSENRPHFIEKVVCDESRYAITGWFA